ncbi:hypothetical protein M1563_03655 [Patescibacteria group bacterium]|nr:hypothetical protein [Patescibacteria group bacterium]
MAIEVRREIIRQLSRLKESDPNHSALPFLKKSLAEYDDFILDSCARRYRSTTHDPENLTDIWQSIWEIWGGRAGIIVNVSLCDRSQQEISKLEAEGRRVFYLPASLSADSDRPLLGKVFGELVSSAFTAWSAFKNFEEESGWLDVEWQNETPYIGTTEDYLIKQFKQKGRVLPTINAFVVGAEFKYLIDGEYFDETGTWCRVASGYPDRRFSAAYRNHYGYSSTAQLGLIPLWSLKHSSIIVGGRSVGLTKRD